MRTIEELIELAMQDPIKFYRTRAWRNLRIESLTRDHNECQRCKAKGLYTRATTAHHIIRVRDNPRLCLTLSNIESICDECHYEEHHPTNPRVYINEEKW